MTSQTVENKVALITGANKGIGLEIARQLGVQGITVLIGARDEKRGQEAAEKLHAEHNIDAHAVQLDVTNQGSIEAAAKHIESEFVDILPGLKTRGFQESLLGFPLSATRLI
jgi:NAD(P)-dependent dehydrogenase (short-subunit alcohol dehydrogenase family)